MENNIQKIYGLIGFGLMTYHYYYHRTDSYSNIILLGYICLTLSFIPWFFNSEIKHKVETPKQIVQEEKTQELITKLGHLLITVYYGYKITHKMDLHLILGLCANGLYLTKWKNYSHALLLVYYIESLFHGYGNIGLTSLILYYYYQLKINK